MSKLVVALACLGVLFRAPLSASDRVSELLQSSQQLIERGDLAGARNTMTQALKSYPGEAGFHNLLGVVEAQTGNFAAAETAFRKSIQLAPRFTGALLNLGRLYQEHPSEPGALMKGLETYRAVLVYEPANVEANYQAAVLLLRQRSFQLSLRHLDRLPAAVQQRAQFLAIRCADYVGLKDPVRSAATARQLAGSTDLSEEDVAEVRGNRDIEIELLEALLSKKRASPESVRRLATLHEEKEQYPEARATLEKAAAEQTVSAPLLLDLARVAYKQQDREGALGYLAHARDLEPGNAAVHFFFGMIAVELNLPLDAKDSLKKAAELAPDNAYYNYALGAVLSQGSDAGEAIRYFEKYCALKKEDPRGRFALGVAYFNNNQFDLAEKELRAVAASPETAAGAHYYLGRMALMLDEDTARARAELDKALAANPNYADAYAELGVVHLREKEYALAERALQRAIALDADGFRPNLNLLALYQRTRDPRASAQQARLEEIKKKQWDKQLWLLRRIGVKPY